MACKAALFFLHFPACLAFRDTARVLDAAADTAMGSEQRVAAKAEHADNASSVVHHRHKHSKKAATVKAKARTNFLNEFLNTFLVAGNNGNGLGNQGNNGNGNSGGGNPHIIDDKDLMDLFDKFDANGDNKLAIPEVMILAPLNIDFIRWLEEADKSGNQEVSRGQFKQAVRSFLEEHEHRFNAMDANADGEVTVEEFKAGLEANDVKISGDLLKSFDTNGNGKIGYGEFFVSALETYVEVNSDDYDLDSYQDLYGGASSAHIGLWVMTTLMMWILQ